jgi:phospholipase/carboxylesterase
MDPLDLHVHRWEPPAQAGAPTLVLLHGTGGDENDLLPLARMVAPAAAVLGVRGNVMEQGMPRFFRRLSEGVFDLDDLHRRTAALGDFLAAAGRRYEFSPSSLYALGFSNGANIAASLLLSWPGSLAGGILIRAMVPFEPDQVPDLSGHGVLLSEGRMDPLIPAANAERLAEILEGAGADVELAWQSGGHGLTQGDVTVARRWLAQRPAPPLRSA